MVEATTMGSLFEELARREAAVRQRIEEIGERITELTGLLEVEEDKLSRLVITRETVEEVVGEAAGTVEDLAAERGAVDPGRGAGSSIGVMTVPPWRPGMTGSALPEAYRDAVEILADAAEPMRAGQIAAVMGLQDTAAKREGLRTKLKRLVERGWAVEDGPGLFTLTAAVAGELAAGPGAGPDEREGGIASSPAR
ncbi:hypothetical protein [Actinomadura gamaensis]|uniref:SMC-Scp complex subunit ScpB n=1 Tax=Actinomadura gamaensis TaxID=1763541 RepID=A0ABV9TUB4_9ACTN